MPVAFDLTNLCCATLRVDRWRTHLVILVISPQCRR